MGSLRFERAGTTLTALMRDGAGTPLVILPGVMADAESWRLVVDHIHLPNPVVVVNRRGRRPSGPQGPHYSVRTEIDDLHQVLDDLGTGAHRFRLELRRADRGRDRDGARRPAFAHPVRARHPAVRRRAGRAAAGRGRPR